MIIARTNLDGVMLLTPKKHEDARGNFFENWNQKTLSAEGIDLDFVQENQSSSTKVGTVRGLHFQAPPHAQDKLVRCIRGSLFDVAVDIRCGSPTYGKWAGFELSDENARQMLIPKGFLHGYVTLAPNTEILYKCTDHYAPETEDCIYYADSDIAIEWGMDTNNATLSERDRNAQSFKEFKSPFIFPEPAKLA